MRMRRKKNLKKRLQACGDHIYYMHSDDKNYQTAIKEKDYINYAEVFGNDNPIELEIGCGKGQFACEIAKKNPDKNYIAVEKSANVIVQACERAISEEISNLLFVYGGAEYLPRYIPEESVDRIYLNFSCPFPKKKYANHRLTHHNFLSIYSEILSENGEIHQKTDNMHFFEFSIEQFSSNGYCIKNVSLDLHKSGIEDNIETEYERRFSDLGQPIYRLEAYKNLIKEV